MTGGEGRKQMTGWGGGEDTDDWGEGRKQMTGWGWGVGGGSR